MAEPGVRGGIALLGMSASSCAVQTTAERGIDFAALDMKINLLRPVHPDGQQLVATGTVLHRGRRLAIGTAEVRHGGRLVAVITGTTELTPAEPEPTAVVVSVRPGPDDPHPATEHGARLRMTPSA
jgi:uncharacterized protein (TIGR00369 family)